MKKTTAHSEHAPDRPRTSDPAPKSRDLPHRGERPASDDRPSWTRYIDSRLRQFAAR